MITYESIKQSVNTSSKLAKSFVAQLTPPSISIEDIFCDKVKPHQGKTLWTHLLAVNHR